MVDRGARIRPTCTGAIRARNGSTLPGPDSTSLGGGVASAASKGNERRVLRMWGRTRRDLETGSLRVETPPWGSLRPVGPQRTEPQPMPIEQLVPRSQSLALRGGRALSARMTHITGKPPNRASGDCTRTEDLNSLARIYLRIYLRLPLAPLGPRFAALCAHTCGRHLAGPNLETFLCTCTKFFHAASIHGVGGHTSCESRPT